MVFNKNLSGGIDSNENKLKNSLRYTPTTNSVKVRVDGSTYCYLYFDFPTNKLSEYLSNNISTTELWNSTLEDDGY